MSVNVDPVLAAALAPLLRDLDAGHVPEPRLDDAADVFPGVDQATSVLLCEPDGSGMMVSITADAPYPEQLARLADQVQEWAVEFLWSLGKSAVWPQCPEHPDSHPLQAQVVDEYTKAASAVWRCPKSGNVVALIGELTSAT